MTLASVLFGGSGGANYRSGNLYLSLPGAASGAGSVANRDHLIPFVPRRLMTLDKVAWYRDNTNAASVYVGLYNSAGTLLTDCAVDTDTTVGWHLVDTTNVTLMAGEFYWLCWNASADVAAVQATDATAVPALDAIREYGLAVGIGTADANPNGIGQGKNRTAAALLSTLTMSGFALSSGVPMMGVVAA